MKENEISHTWWNSGWTSSHLSISALPSGLSMCPRSCVHPAQLAQSSVHRRRWNSWWKCRRPYPILLYCSGLRSRTLTFQFLVMEGDSLVFKVFTLNRVQQRFWRRSSLTFPFLVEVFKVHLVLTFQLLFMKVQTSLVKGFFGLFPVLKKQSGVRGRPPGRAHGLRRFMVRVLWLTTTKASSRTKLAMCGPGLPRTPCWTLLVRLGYVFVVMTQKTGGTWTLSTPSGGRRGTAELVDPPPAQGGM